MKASVLIPTTSDRGPLLVHSVGSVLRQTVRDLEVLIIGDGVNEETREAIHSLQEQDARVRFFDFPKGERRGEPYRHQVLSADARGEIVCYLCDRDLMLPHHVETLYSALQSADFAHTLLWGIREDGSFEHKRTVDLSKAAYSRAIARGVGMFGLSFTGHRKDAYLALPQGWRVTPADRATDHYMWEQFLQEPSCRAVSCPVPTILYFKRGNHPGWSVVQREPELAAWSERVRDKNEVAALVREVEEDFARLRVRLYRSLMSWNLRHPRMRFAFRALSALRKATRRVATPVR